MSAAVAAHALDRGVERDFIIAGGGPFELAAGGVLAAVSLRATVYGELNARRDNAVLVCHALSGSSRVAEWWPDLFGPGNVLDPDRYCVIGINAIGSCYGSTGPGSVDPATGVPYAASFPLVQVEDIVRAQALLLDELGVESLELVIGGSIGGMQALEWVTRFPARVRRACAIGAAPLSPMGLALNHLQRQAIALDVDRGLGLARAIAMCTYKSSVLFDRRFGRQPNRNGEDPRRDPGARFDVAGYLDFQGDRFRRRFAAESYVALSKAMDLFDPFAADVPFGASFAGHEPHVLLVGISSDWLFPAADVHRLARSFRNAGVDARYRELVSGHGHDAFLADGGKVARLVLEEKW